MDDVVAVMEAAGVRAGRHVRAAGWWGDGGAVPATHPERTTALLLYEASRGLVGADYASAPRREEREGIGRNRIGRTGRRRRVVPERRRATRGCKSGTGRLERLSASPGTRSKLMRMNAEIECGPSIPSIQMPTLVLHRAARRDGRCPSLAVSGRAHPGGQFVELPGDGGAWFGSDTMRKKDEIEEFSPVCVPFKSGPDPGNGDVLDIVDSTSRAAELGEESWRDLLDLIDRSIARTGPLPRPQRQLRWGTRHTPAPSGARPRSETRRVHQFGLRDARRLRAPARGESETT